MTAVFRFALRSLARRPATAMLLAVSLGLAFGLPGAVRAVVTAFDRELRSRAAAAPLVLGEKGSGSDLVLHALYFQGSPPGRITVADRKAFDRNELAGSVPILAGATARGVPVVGTDVGYFRLRGLWLSAGGPAARMGDAVVGADAARQLGLAPGGKPATDPENLFGRSGGVPVRLRVVGVLRPTGTADDSAVFVSLETAWLIAGLGHAHAASAAGHKHEDGTTANAGGFVEVTDENVRRFHFHGNRDRFPLTAVLTRPRDEKARLLLVGRYLNAERVQLAEGDRVVARLLDVALRLKRLFDAHAAATLATSLLLCGTVIALTVRLRGSEIRTMGRLGISRPRIVALIAVEFGMIAAGAAVVAAGVAYGAAAAAPALFRWLVL